MVSLECKGGSVKLFIMKKYLLIFLFFGAFCSPVPLHQQRLSKCRKIAAGRFVNCYVPRDMVLQLMFRHNLMTSSGIFQTPCGTAPVNIAGIEDYDVSQFVSWHADYCVAIRSILRMIGHGQPTLYCNKLNGSSRNSSTMQNTGSANDTSNSSSLTVATYKIILLGDSGMRISPMILIFSLNFVYIFLIILEIHSF